MAESYDETALSNGYEFTGGSGYELPEYPFRAPPEIASASPATRPSSSWAAASRA